MPADKGVPLNRSRIRSDPDLIDDPLKGSDLPKPKFPFDPDGEFWTNLFIGMIIFLIVCVGLAFCGVLLWAIVKFTDHFTSGVIYGF